MNSFTEKLISAVKERPVLYMSDRIQSKCAYKRLQAWRQIQNELGDKYTIEVLKSKWRNLKDTYRKWKQAQVGLGCDNSLKLKNWPWSRKLHFLDSEMFKKNKNSESTNREVKEEFQDQNVFEDIDNIDLSNENIVIEYLEEPHTEFDTTVIDQPILIQNSEDVKHKSLKHKKTNDSRVNITCDGVDLLFLGYADSYKKLSKLNQANVKFGIAKLLLKAELNDMNVTQKRKQSTVESDTDDESN